MEKRMEERMDLEDNGVAKAVFGESGSHLTLLEKRLGIEAHARSGQVLLRGEAGAVAIGRLTLSGLAQLARRKVPIGPEEVVRVLEVIRQDPSASLPDIFCDTVLVSGRARAITPKGLAQKRYVDALRQHDIVFAVGPAGTGKTYLAVAMAVLAYQEQRVRRIVLTRPAVEAGERLGFLPGTMEDKVNPYLRPLYDALNDLLSFDKVAQLMERGHIEIAPLAFMRGRTLNDSFVILDEAQNTTSEQMKMFLTRLGYDSQAVITGDITQVDLPSGCSSGLVEAERILSGVEGLAFCHFTEVDVVRHPLVQEIIRAWELKGRPNGSRTRGAAGAQDPRADGPGQPRSGVSASASAGVSADASGGTEAEAGANAEPPGAGSGGQAGVER
ncbi:MAG: PhoH family protein [Polyangia bacterium]|jgi:phosphate starvation-inducible PhoH-like protein|nr:PhoH family protein [Polyangia bacterium]